MDADILIDSIAIDIDIAVGTSIPQTTYNGMANIAQVTASIEVRCADGFYGPDCCETNIDCEDIDCNNGVCANDFRCQCDPGFTGDRCDTNICEGVDCNNGVCINETNDFYCECNPGFTGDRCDTNICEGVDCNNGICVEENGDFRCDCISGFTGNLCQGTYK